LVLFLLKEHILIISYLSARQRSAQELWISFLYFEYETVFLHSITQTQIKNEENPGPGKLRIVSITCAEWVIRHQIMFRRSSSEFTENSSCLPMVYHFFSVMHASTLIPPSAVSFNLSRLYTCVKMTLLFSAPSLFYIASWHVPLFFTFHLQRITTLTAHVCSP
jgi:hypothetical protein